MDEKYVVLEGKVFVIELASNLGSTNYGWCVSELPKQLTLVGIDNVPASGTIKMRQRFYFGAVSSDETEVEVVFTMNNLSDVKIVTDQFTAKVNIVSSDSADFVAYSENEVNTVMPYGYVSQNSAAQDANLKYGYPCGAQDANLKYGYPCGVQDAVLKYGYPCGAQDAVLKYGYPCMEYTKDARPYGYVGGEQDAVLKYGYPCGAQDAVLKYGYPCGAQDAVLKYGYPCGAQDAVLKYGYPCGAQDANLKYGYPCMEYTKDARPYGYPCGVQDAVLKYGYPCGAQDAVLKYGYPCGAQDANLKYGYPCMEYTKDARPYGYWYS